MGPWGACGGEEGGVREKKGRAAQSPAGTHLHASILQHLEHVLLHVALRQRKVDLHIVVRNRRCHFF
jgi:hypothetical protein